MSEIIKKENLEGYIALGLEKLDAYLETLKEWQKRLFQQLDKNDYKEPFAGSDVKILTKTGARKLGKILKVSTEIKNEEFLRDANGNVLGYKVLLRVSLPNGDFIETTGYYGYDDASALIKDKRTGEVIGKKSVYHLINMAYKRAYVEAIKYLLGLPGSVDEMLEDEEEASEIVASKIDVSKKQVEFFADLYMKRHLTKQTAEKVIDRLMYLINSGKLDTQTMSNAIDFLTKYQKNTEEFNKSWEGMTLAQIMQYKGKLLMKFLQAVNMVDVAKNLMIDIETEKTKGETENGDDALADLF